VQVVYKYQRPSVVYNLLHAESDIRSGLLDLVCYPTPCLRTLSIIFFVTLLKFSHSIGFLRKVCFRQTCLTIAVPGCLHAGEGAGRAWMDDLVVTQWVSDVESGSHLDLLLQEDV
jgi:hypothetical protein